MGNFHPKTSKSTKNVFFKSSKKTAQFSVKKRVHRGVSLKKKLNFYCNEFGCEGTILVSVARKRHFFPIWINRNLKKISWMLGKMAFHIVIWTMFQFSVFRSILIKSAYILRYLDIKGITFHFNHSPEFSRFLRNEWPSVRFLHAFWPLDYNFMK